MKHIKIFEEFTPEKKPIFKPEKITNNERGLMTSKTGSNVIEYDGNNYLLYNKIEKMPDGFWLVDETIQCSSINDLITICKDLTKEAIDWFQDVINTMTENIFNKYITDYLLGDVIIRKYSTKEFKIEDVLISDFRSRFNIPVEGMEILMLNMLEKHLNVTGYEILIEY